MSVFNWATAIALGFLSSVVPAGATADIVQFTFEGTVDHVNGQSYHPTLNDVELGDPVTVEYTFDSNAPDQAPDDQWGEYSMLSYSMFVGGERFEFTEQTITVVPLPGSINYDAYGYTQGQFPLGILPQLEVTLANFDDPPFTDDSLPAELPFDQLDDWRLIQYNEADGYDSQFTINASITSYDAQVVAAPGAAGILIGVAFGRRLRRRR